MTEMPSIATDPSAATSPGRALDVICAEPLLRAPLVERLERDGHSVRLHDGQHTAFGDGSPDGGWTLQSPLRSPLAVVVLPPSALEAVRGGWVTLVRQLLVEGPMVLVASAGNVSAPLLAGTGGEHGFVVLDRESLDDDWAGSIALAVHRALQGLREIAPTFLRTRVTPTGLDALTPNERIILRLISEGLSNAAIAQVQFVGERTVESHIRRIYAKLELPDSPAVQRRVLATLLYLGEHRPLPVAD